MKKPVNLKVYIIYICHVNFFLNIKHLTRKTTKVNGVIENNHK